MFERFDETFDEYNGGALYVCDYADGTYGAVGISWMDGGEQEYFACSARFDEGDEFDFGAVNSKYDAADAFNEITDPYVDEEIGWFDNIDDAIQAVNEWIEEQL